MRPIFATQPTLDGGGLHGSLRCLSELDLARTAVPVPVPVGGGRPVVVGVCMQVITSPATGRCYARERTLSLYMTTSGRQLVSSHTPRRLGLAGCHAGAKIVEEVVSEVNRGLGACAALALMHVWCVVPVVSHRALLPRYR